MINLHPSSIVQSALVKMLRDVPQSYFDETKAKLKQAADFSFDSLSGIRGKHL